MSDSLNEVIAYHEATKHHYHAYAPGPGMLDWATQPDPFRRYVGAELLPLNKYPTADGPAYEQALIEGSIDAATLEQESIAPLYNAITVLSTWKQAGGN